MKNKLLVNKMKNNAELAMAAYGYYDLMTSDINPLFIKLKNEKENNKTNSDENFTKKEINLVDIMDITYNGYGVYTPSPLPTLQPEKVGKLKGDFSPTQTKRFFKKYDMLKHCPNTESNGFSATFFYNKESKEYILAIRGTEFKLDQIKDLINDYYIGTNNDRKTA
ncbi:hypothetical protein CNT09_09300 [Campylobacter coli]|nr:hypothetical protein [Campylobacter coli]EAK6386305.1 hypothetical protein [Campylobacter coli]